MRILIDGYGSIGRQYAKFLSTKHEVYFYDPYLPSNFASALHVKRIRNLTTILFDLIIIASPSGTHVEKLNAYKIFNCPILVEKPLVYSAFELDQYDLLIKSNPELISRVIVSSPRRFSPSYIALCHQCSDVLANPNEAFFRFSHSLRRMKGSNWRQSYIFAEKNCSNIVFDCIHELDIASSLFGHIESLDIVYGESPMYSGVSLISFAKASHQNGKQTYHYFDFFSDLKIRSMCISSMDGTFNSVEIGKSNTKFFATLSLNINDGESFVDKPITIDDAINPLELQITTWIDENFVVTDKYCNLTSARAACRAILQSRKLD